jgi:hypothetical protein
VSAPYASIPPRSIVALDPDTRLGRQQSGFYFRARMPALLQLAAVPQIGDPNDRTIVCQQLSTRAADADRYNAA